MTWAAKPIQDSDFADFDKRILSMDQQSRIVAGLESIRRDFPYWSRVINMVNLSEEPRISTVRIDAYCRIQFNKSFIYKLTDLKTLKAVLIHELEHYLRGHHHRCQELSDYIISVKKDISTYQDLYNLAADLEINSDLANLPDGAVYPEIFGLKPGLLLEEYVGLLKDKVNIIKISTGEMGRMSGDIKLPQSEFETDEARALLNEVVNDVDEARRQGRYPGDSKHRLKYKKKNYNWRKVIRNTVYRLASEREYGDEQSTYSSVNRRFLCVPNIIYPKFYNLKYEIRILFAVDTSGSMHDKLDKCFSYLMSLRKFNEEIKISLLTVDTKVNSYIENVTQLPSYAKGLGGTEMTAVFNYADEKKLRYDLLLLLTDCQTDWPSPAKVPTYYNKTIILSANSGHAYGECPFRKYIIK